MNEENSPSRNAVCIIIETIDGWILQKRDDKDGIWSPDKVNHWGGAFESEDKNDPLLAAKRELQEETALEATSVEFKQFLVEDYETVTEEGEPEILHSYCFLVRVTDNSNIFVHEGSGSVLIPFDVDLDDSSLELSSFTHHLLLELRRQKNEA